MPQDPHFKEQYRKHLKCLRLGVLQPNAIDAYARAIRRIRNYFSGETGDLTSEQVRDYFTDLLVTHSLSAVNLDLYGPKFFYSEVVRKPWENLPVIKPPGRPEYPIFSPSRRWGCYLP